MGLLVAALTRRGPHVTRGGGDSGNGVEIEGMEIVDRQRGFADFRAIIADQCTKILVLGNILLEQPDFINRIEQALAFFPDHPGSERRKAKLPPLWIATDQEGGPVSKLSPPLSRQQGLGSILKGLDGPNLTNKPERAAEIVRRVTAYADIQGKELAAAGINLNFAPVVDLRPANPPGALDFHSRIATRALAADPATVALAGEIYVRSLRCMASPRF